MAKHSLLIADNLKLPEEFVTQTACIFGKRGTGKSSTAVRVAEQFAACGIQFAVLDPPDAWWGLKSSKDGKRAGLPVYVFGGSHGDLPLESTAGSLMADILVDHKISVVMSLRHFTIGERSRFCIDFANQLFKRKGTDREPLMLFCEEAHRLFPQTREEYGKGSRIEEMLGAMNKLHTEGRTSGIGLVLISQRPALVHATPRNQAEILITHRVIGPHDRKAIEEWVRYHHQDDDAQKKFLESLAVLKTGECWFWAPEWPEENPIGMRRVQVLEPETYDSRRTPKPGEKRAEPKKLAPVDIEVLRGKMAATIERVKADDPKELRKRIAELEKQQASRKIENKDAIQNIIKSKVLEARKRGAEEMNERWLKWADELRRSIMAASYPGLEWLGKNQAQEIIVKQIFDSHEKKQIAKEAAGRLPERNGSTALPIGEKSTLIAIAQMDWAERRQLSVLTGYKRSSRDAFISRLKARGFIREAMGKVQVTESGLEALGSDYKPLPTGRKLQEYWDQRLPEGERAILRILLDAGPQPTERESFDRLTNYKRSSRDAFLSRLQAKNLVEYVGRGQVIASATLFD